MCMYVFSFAPYIGNTALKVQFVADLKKLSLPISHSEPIGGDILTQGSANFFSMSLRVKLLIY